MNLLKRFGYYFAGFAVGLIFLAFFLNKKKAEFCYGIDCRIMKNIRSKNLVYSEQAKDYAERYAVDSINIQYLLHKGDVNMSKSNTAPDSCKIYVVEGPLEKGMLELTITNCDKTATITTIKLE